MSTVIRKIIVFTICISFAFSLSACVSQKEYDELQSQYNSLNSDFLAMKLSKDQLEAERNAAESSLHTLKEEYDTLLEDYQELEKDYEELKRSDYLSEIKFYAERFNMICDESYVEKIDITAIPDYISDLGYFIYPISNWVDFKIIPTEDLTSVEMVILDFDPSKRGNLWLLDVFSLIKDLIMTVYPIKDYDDASAVTLYYEDTLYNGSWYFPPEDCEGKYTEDGICCDLFKLGWYLRFCCYPQ